MSLGGKYVFATVMCLVLPMCFLVSCSSVLCVLIALGMFTFLKVMSSLISVMIIICNTLFLFYFKLEKIHLFHIHV